MFISKLGSGRKAILKGYYAFSVVFGLIFFSAGVMGFVHFSRELERDQGRAALSVPSLYVALLAGLLFCGVGMGIVVSSLRQWGRIRHLLQLQEKFPDEPWLWNEEWRLNRISSQGKSQKNALWSMALFWNLICSGMFYPLIHGKLPAWTAVFPAVGLGLLGVAIYLTLRWRRYGESFVELRRIPCVPGGKVEGRVETRLPRASTPREVEVRLENLSASGDDSPTLLWQDRRKIELERLEEGMEGWVIPFSFLIPSDARVTSGSIGWQLTVSAEMPGVDYSATFRIPVFEDPSFFPSKEPEPEGLSLKEPESAPRLESGVKTSLLPDGGTEFYFPPARGAGMLFGMTIFLVIWVGMIRLMMKHGAPWPFPMLFGFFAVLLVWGLLDIALRRTRVRVREGEIRVRSGWTPWRTEKMYGSGEVSAIQAEREGQSGTKFYFRIRILLKSGKGVSAGTRIASLREAEYWAREMEKGLKGPEKF